MDPDIDAAAEAALALTAERGLNEWRSLFVATRMVAKLMERTGCRVGMGLTVCEEMRALAGEEMARVEEVRKAQFARKRR